MKKPKVSKTDYTVSMLPTTRREVFFDVIKLNKGKLLTLGVISFLFMVPFVVLTVVQSYYENYLLSANVSGMITAQEALVDLTVFRNLIALIKCVFYIFFAVMLSGLSRVIKLFSWEENVNLSADFFKGIKQNIKQYLILGLLFSAIMFLCDFVTDSFSGFFIFDTLINYGYIMKALCLVFLAPIGAYMLITCCVYDLNFGQQIRYSLLVYGKNFLRSLIALLCCLIIFVPQVVGKIISNTVCQIIGSTVSGLMLPIVLLGWFCFGFGCLDKSVNKDRYPDLVGRGFYSNEETK